jgi:O-antigen ligase/Flp pilus assembly protein TadD
MKLDKIGVRASIDSPTLGFLAALVCVMLAVWFPFIPNWQTFIHPWRVEASASLLLIGTLVFFMLRIRKSDPALKFDADEWMFVILPMLAFILWSAVSATWAASWKSAAHHTFVWAEYLVFYIVFRRMVESGRSAGILLSVFVLTLLFYSLPAIVEYCALLTFGGTTTIGIRYAKFGEQIVTLIPLVLLGVVRMRGNRFAIGLAAVTALWLLIFCSLGRANYLLFGMAVVALFAAVAISKRYRQYAPRFALVIVVLAVAPLPLHLFSFFSTVPAVPVIDRFSDPNVLDNSNNFRRLMISVASEMIGDHPVVGIGADNFGMEVNKYRQAYGAANPQDTNLANAEDQIPEHAHNEFLQIAAELGAVGVALMAWLLFGIGLLTIRSLRNLRNGSLFPFAAVLGLGMFLLSSLVSSYSFRVMQNGIVFFFVLAVASSALFRRREDESAPSSVTFTPARLRLACASGILVCLGLLGYSALRVSSVIMTSRANQTPSTEAAMQLYETAMTLDDENPDARHNLGMRLFRRERYGEAVPYLESAIQIGRAPSAELSYLATAKTLSGDPAGAEATMKAASELYPRSPFVLTRYSTLLDSHGNTAEAVSVFQRAKTINESAAKTWQAVIVSGPKALSELAARDKSYMQVMQLKPESSIYAVVTERYIKFPDEQRFSIFKPTVKEP